MRCFLILMVVSFLAYSCDSDDGFDDFQDSLGDFSYTDADIYVGDTVYARQFDINLEFSSDNPYAYEYYSWQESKSEITGINITSDSPLGDIPAGTNLNKYFLISNVDAFLYKSIDDISTLDIDYLNYVLTFTNDYDYLNHDDNDTIIKEITDLDLQLSIDLITDGRDTTIYIHDSTVVKPYMRDDYFFYYY